MFVMQIWKMVNNMTEEALKLENIDSTQCEGCDEWSEDEAWDVVEDEITYDDGPHVVISPISIECPKCGHVQRC